MLIAYGVKKGRFTLQPSPGNWFVRKIFVEIENP